MKVSKMKQIFNIIFKSGQEHGILDVYALTALGETQLSERNILLTAY
jgi:hypothetical protein